MNATSALFTDLYEVTMAQAYHATGMSGDAVFETFYRRLPATRKYVMAAGLSDVLDFLETFRFEADELEYLRTLGMFSEEFLRHLAEVRFSGEVWAVPEGTLVFPGEPIVQVAAPIIEAQLVETFVLNQIHFQSVVASKAARLVDAAAGRPVIDFGARRAHGTDAALKMARASYLAGAAGTSNLLAARRYRIPAFGTMAHSYVQSFDDEAQCFECFCRIFPGTTLLVDTYDTLQGVDIVIALAERLGARFDARGIRLDSGDLGELSKQARARLDAAGLPGLEIFASSDLDEFSIAALVAQGCPIDAFGVGTRLAVSKDAPALDMAYKLVEYDGVGRGKLSAGKVFYPGRKQIFREVKEGVFVGDVLGQMDEELPGARLLVKVMEGGRRLESVDGSLSAARRHAASQVATCPTELRSLDDTGASYVVRPSRKLELALERFRAAHGGRGHTQPGPRTGPR
jgi:nicotinate phosphoribosyltransferase